MTRTNRRLSALSLAAAWLALPGPVRGQTQVFEIAGNQAGASYGAAVAGGYDFDGHDDVVIGAPNADAGGKTDDGVVRIVSGATGAALVTKIGDNDGDNDGDHFGYALAICGDVNGDGVHDVIVGAPDALVSGAKRGMARVISRSPAQEHIERNYRRSATVAAGAPAECVVGLEHQFEPPPREER